MSVYPSLSTFVSSRLICRTVCGSSRYRYCVHDHHRRFRSLGFKQDVWLQSVIRSTDANGYKAITTKRNKIEAKQSVSVKNDAN